MARDDIIKMAREAGFNLEQGFLLRVTGIDEDLERFAALVAAAEREACAKVCEGLGVHPALNVFNGGPEWYKHGKDCAAAIRARGNK
jgi:hypothetical protein